MVFFYFYIQGFFAYGPLEGEGVHANVRHIDGVVEFGVLGEVGKIRSEDALQLAVSISVPLPVPRLSKVVTQCTDPHMIEC